MRVAILVSSLVLAGCATSGQQASAELRNSLDAMVGQPVEVAIARLGEPMASVPLGSESVYGWGYGFTRTEYTNAAPGWVNAADFRGGVFPAPRRRIQDSCVIRILAGADGLIRHWDYQDNDQGCSEFADRLVGHSTAQVGS